MFSFGLRRIQPRSMYNKLMSCYLLQWVANAVSKPVLIIGFVYCACLDSPAF